MESATAPKWQHDGSKRTEGEVLALLHALVLAKKPALCIETGTFAGHGTKAISEALEANENGHLYTIENDGDLFEQLREIDLPRTTFMFEDSLAFAADLDDWVDFAFVDCGEWPHRVQVVRRLWPKMVDKGLLLLHDTIFYPDLLPAVERDLGTPNLHLLTLHGLAIWEK